MLRLRLRGGNRNIPMVTNLDCIHSGSLWSTPLEHQHPCPVRREEHTGINTLREVFLGQVGLPSYLLVPWKGFIMHKTQPTAWGDRCLLYVVRKNGGREQVSQSAAPWKETPVQRAEISVQEAVGWSDSMDRGLDLQPKWAHSHTFQKSPGHIHGVPAGCKQYLTPEVISSCQ